MRRQAFSNINEQSQSRLIALIPTGLIQSSRNDLHITSFDHARVLHDPELRVEVIPTVPIMFRELWDNVVGMGNAVVGTIGRGLGLDVVGDVDGTEMWLAKCVLVIVSKEVGQDGEDVDLRYQPTFHNSSTLPQARLRLHLLDCGPSSRFDSLGAKLERV